MTPWEHCRATAERAARIVEAIWTNDHASDASTLGVWAIGENRKQGERREHRHPSQR
jgi:hypothetical protein